MHARTVRVIISPVTGRVLFTIGWVFGALAFVGSAADAAPKRKVKIDTEPAGATVYLNAKEDGPVCTTPCTIDAPVGDTPIIVELENHKQIFEQLTVPAKKPLTVKYKLEPAIGTINVTGPAGARITVDDEDKGKAPTKIEIGAGAHTVILTLNGKQIASEFVEVAANDEVEVAGTAKKPTGKSTGGGAKAAPTETAAVEEPEGETGGITTTTPGPARPRRGPILAISAVFDVGFRNFEYQDAKTPNLSSESEGGQVLVGPLVEVWPGTMLGIRALRGFSLMLKFGYGVNSQQVTDKMTGAATDAKTFWRSFETSARQRWRIGNAATIEVGGGYVRDQYQFSGDAADIKLVPDADYQSVRVGLRVSALFGNVEPYLAAENRLVLSGGPIADRFDDASASGLRAAVGVAMKLGAFDVRLEGALNRYSWTFKSNETTDEFRASGGTDSIKFISVVAGYAY